MNGGEARVRLIPAVNAVVFNEKREVLLTRRSPIVREPGKWCLPGGHFDGGENWVTAVRRECREEIGIEVLEESLIGIYSDPQLTMSQFPSGEYGQFLTAVFLVKAYRGEIRTNDEVDDWGWFAIDQLPQPILKSHPIRIQDGHRFNGESFIR